MIFNEKEWKDDGSLIAKPNIEEKYGISGGQGHSADEIFDGATSIAVLVGIAVFLTACYVTAIVF